MRTLKGLVNTIVYNVKQGFLRIFLEPKISSLKYVRILCTNIL